MVVQDKFRPSVGSPESLMLLGVGTSALSDGRAPLGRTDCACPFVKASIALMRACWLQLAMPSKPHAVPGMHCHSGLPSRRLSTSSITASVLDSCSSSMAGANVSHRNSSVSSVWNASNANSASSMAAAATETARVS